MNTENLILKMDANTEEKDSVEQDSLDVSVGWDYHCGGKARELLRQKKRYFDQKHVDESEEIVTLKKGIDSVCNLYDPSKPFSMASLVSKTISFEEIYLCDWYPKLFGIDEEEIPLSEDEEGLFDIDWDDLESEPQPSPRGDEPPKVHETKGVYQKYQYPRYGRRARQKPVLERENHEKFDCICDIDVNYSRHYIPHFGGGEPREGEELKTPHFKSFWEDYYEKAGMQESDRWSKIFETTPEEPEEIKGFSYRPTPKFPSSNKREIKKFREQLLATFRPLDCREVRRYRMPFAEAMYLELQEDLYLDCAKFFKNIIIKEYKVRDAVDEKGPRLRDNQLMIKRVVAFLKLAERFSRRKLYHKEATVLLRSGKYFCDYDQDWWWLAEEFYTKAVDVSQKSVLDGGRVAAISHYVLGTFLLDFVHRIQPAQEHLLRARELSMGKDWSAKTILQKKQDTVYKECANYLCRALIAVSRDLRSKGKPEEALPLIRRSHKLCEEAGSERWDVEMETLFELGMAYQEVGYLEWAITAFRKFIEIALLHKCPKNICDGFLELAICFRSQGDMEHCHRYLQTYLKTAEANENENLIAFGNRYLGEFYLNNVSQVKGNSKLAAEYFKKAFHSFYKQNTEILDIPFAEWEPEYFSLAEDVELTRVLTGLAEGEVLTKPICQLILQAKDKKNQKKLLQLIKWKNKEGDKMSGVEITTEEETSESVEEEEVVYVADSSEPLESVPEEETTSQSELPEEIGYQNTVHFADDIS